MDTVQTFRIFVSSPGDAQFERQRVDRVVARLNGELSGTAQLTTVRWETEFYKAHSTFQAQIPEAVDCSVVLAIFRARLGTELPPDFERMPNGEPYPSGTAYEVLTAISRRQRGAELPDVFVFRCSEPPLVRLDEPAQEADARAQWDRLKAFFGRWFLSEDGHFKAAFQTFSSTDDFEGQLERLLRDWLRHRLAREGIVAWPIATMGSPYPGLLSFGPRHAPLFFGRTRDTARGIEAWSEAGARGAPFLLVVGASGSGKSSLARAGLVPRLTTPGVVPSVDVWRVASLRPGENPGGPMAALAHALMQGASDLPASEEGRLPALPEIAAGDYGDPVALATLLAHADATATRPILAALDKIGDAERRTNSFDRPVRCDLVILVDQLDELFAGSVEAEERRRFGALLAALLETGRVWIAATLRADLYELFLKDETLFRLKSDGATFDLAPPVLADLAEAVRGPARAAGLTWEIDPATRDALDDRLVRDIDRADLLPILQFTLDRLFQERVSRNGEVVLTHAAYEALGRLDGAIENAAEAAIAPLGPEAVAALPRLLRSLVTYAASASKAALPSPGLRQATRAALAHDEASNRLVTTLTDARVLITGRDASGAATVSLAHQRVIEAWPRARAAIAQSVDVLRVRDEVEADRRRWEEAGRRNDLLIAPGLPLSEAENAVVLLAGELPPEAIAYVDRSGRAARLHQRLLAIAAMVFLALALGAGALGWVAREQQLKAEAATVEAKEQTRRADAERVQAEQQRVAADTARAQAVQARIGAEAAFRRAEADRQRAEAARREAAERLRTAELRLAAADELLDDSGKTEQLRQCLASTARVSSQPPPKASRAFFVGRWHVDHGGTSTDMDWRADGVCESKGIFNGGPTALDLRKDVCSWDYRHVSDEEFVIDYKSSQLNDDFPKQLRFKIVNPARIHNPEYDYDAFRIVCPGEELRLERERLREAEAGAASKPGDVARQHDLADAVQRVGILLSLQGDRAGALREFARALLLRKDLALAEPTNWVRQFELALGHLQLALEHQLLQNFAPSLDEAERGLSVLQALSLTGPADILIRRNIATAHERIATASVRLGNRTRALETYRRALELRRGIVQSTPGEPQARIDLVLTLYAFSLIADPPEAKQAVQDALDLAQGLERAGRLPSELSAWPGVLARRLAQIP